MKKNKHAIKRIALTALSALLISGCKNKDMEIYNETNSKPESVIDTEQIISIENNLEKAKNPFENLINRIDELEYDEMSKDIIKNIALYTESDEIPKFIKYFLDAENYDRGYYLNELIKEATYEFDNNISYQLNDLKILNNPKDSEQINLLKKCANYGIYKFYKTTDPNLSLCVVTNNEDMVLLITDEYDVIKADNEKLMPFSEFLKSNNIEVIDTYSYDEIEFFDEMLNNNKQTL